jgi:hypothetical protein
VGADLRLADLGLRQSTTGRCFLNDIVVTFAVALILDK